MLLGVRVLSFHYQLLYGHVQAVQRQGEHGEGLGYHLHGVVVPVLRAVRVQPHGMCEVVRDALEPVDARDIVALVVVYRAPALGELPGRHARVAHYYQLVVRRECVQQVVGAHRLVPLDIVVNVVVDAVVEVVVLEIPEMRAGVRRGEELAAHQGERVHGAAHVHKQQHLDRILARALPD